MKLLLVYACAYLGTCSSLRIDTVSRDLRNGPKVYKNKEEMKLLVHELRSVKTQVPLKYYDLPFCPLEGKSPPEEYYQGLGQRLEGHATQESAYKMEVGKEAGSEVLCELRGDKSLNGEQIANFARAIDMEYMVDMSVDYLPAGSKKSFMVSNEGNEQKTKEIYSKMYMLGYVDKGDVIINNHITITAYLHPLPGASGEFNIVKLMVTPYSIDHEDLDNQGKWKSDDPEKNITSLLKEGKPKVLRSESASNSPSKLAITFTYDVHWEKSEKDWSRRWEVFMNETEHDSDIQWRSNIQSFLIVMLLTALVAMILARALRRDIQRYNAEDIEDAKEEFGWKLVHGDVFRPPRTMPTFFAVVVGTGVQLLATIFLLLIFGYAGFVPIAKSGSTLTALMIIFIFMGSLSGYVSSRIHRMFRGTNWLKTTALTSVLYPGFCIFIFTIVNIAERIFSSNSITSYFGTVVYLILLWAVQAPLVFIGSYYGFKCEPRTDPVRTNQIPRQIPPQPWYLSPYFSIPLSGFLPFGAVIVEIVFVMNELWLSEVYSIFGFLSAAGVILVLTCAEIAIVMCYFQLCAEDYCWWWRSLQWAGSCSFYLFLYSIFYQVMQLQISTVLGHFIYFCYCTLIAVSFGLATSATGYFSCYYFIRTIMASIKVD